MRDRRICSKGAKMTTPNSELIFSDWLLRYVRPEQLRPLERLFRQHLEASGQADKYLVDTFRVSRLDTEGSTRA